MNTLEPREFLDQVLEHAGPLSVNAVLQAVQHFIDTGRAQPHHVAECIQFAGGIESDRQREEEVESRDERPPVQRPTGRRRENELRLTDVLSNIEATVDALRKQVFGPEGRPFASIKEAARWLQRQCPGHSKQQRARAAASVLFDRIDDAVDRVNKVSPSLVRIDEVIPWIALEVEGEEKVYSVGKSEPVWVLYFGVRRLSRATGIPHRQLTSYILADQIPDPPPIVIRRVSPGPPDPDPTLRGTRVVIELDIDDVTEERFGDLYRALRHWLGVSRRKNLTDRDRVLLQVVNALDGVPRETPNSKSFWERVRKHRKLRQRYKTAAAAREAYGRAEAREKRSVEKGMGEQLHLVKKVRRSRTSAGGVRTSG